MWNNAGRNGCRSTHVRRYATACFGACSLLVVCGCGGAYSSTAYGTVTLDGKAVPRGAVAFLPTAGGPAAYGLIEEDGKYKVRTGRESGLPAGEYFVTVTANEAPAISSEQRGAPPPGKAITPAWYRMKETSGLKFTLQPGKNEINLELISKPPAGWKPGGQKSA